MFHPKKGTVPYSNQIENLIFHSKPPISWGWVPKIPAPSFFNPKKSSILTKRPNGPTVSPRPRPPGRYLRLQGTHFDARERLARYKWRGYMSVSHPESHHPPERFFRDPGSDTVVERMEMESTHPNHPRGIEKPNESPKKWEKPCVVSHFGGGGGGRESSTFLFGFL